MSKVYDPLKDFRRLYPTPVQLDSPLYNPADGKIYDWFANYHITVNACQLCIKLHRGRYGVFCRGWLPKHGMDTKLAVTYNSCWTLLALWTYPDDAVESFTGFARELLDMSPDDFAKFRHIARKLNGLV